MNPLRYLCSECERPVMVVRGLAVTHYMAGIAFPCDGSGQPSYEDEVEVEPEEEVSASLSLQSTAKPDTGVATRRSARPKVEEQT